MLLFRSEEEVARWCSGRRLRPGAVVSLDVLWRLAKEWYGDRLDPEWRPRSREESQAIFDRVGLTGPFWCLP